MNINNNYGKLLDETIEYAPSVIQTENAIIFAPTQEVYLENGWKIIDLSQPTEPAGEGKHWEEDGYDENDTTIMQKWKIVDDPIVYKRYSVPDLFFWLKQYDVKYPEKAKGQDVVDFLNSQNLYTIAVTTRVVSENNEYFTPTIDAIKETVGFTDAEITEALAYAETQSEPDAVV